MTPNDAKLVSSWLESKHPSYRVDRVMEGTYGLVWILVASETRIHPRGFAAKSFRLPRGERIPFDVRELFKREIGLWMRVPAHFNIVMALGIVLMPFLRRPKHESEHIPIVRMPLFDGSLRDLIGGLDSLRLAPPADHRPPPRYGKGTASVAGLRLARRTPPRFSATAPPPNRSAHPDNTVSAAEDRCRSAPSLPATNRCDPCHPRYADAPAKTSGPEFVIRHAWLQEGRSALHRFPEYWDCKDKTCPAFDITNRKIQRFRDELRLVPSVSSWDSPMGASSA